MFFIERKEPYVLPNILGNHSMPVHTFRWKIIAKCEERQPLEKALKNMDSRTHRIISNMAE